jgi:peptide/nickel transport system permease protein
MGRLVIQSVILEDFNVVAAVVAILTVAYVMMNFLVDVLYSILDPRIRHAAR